MAIERAQFRPVVVLLFLGLTFDLIGCSRSNNAEPVAAPTPTATSLAAQPNSKSPKPVTQQAVVKDLHGLQLSATWSADLKSAKIQFANVYLAQTPATIGSEVDAARGRVDFLTYKMCLLYPPAESANQAKCDKLIDRVEAESNKLPKW